MERLHEITERAIRPALALLPAPLACLEAIALLLAIGLQESKLVDRWQIVDPHHPLEKGPARSLWQFELGSQFRGGGVWGVFAHPSSRYWLAQVCAARRVDFCAYDIWVAIEQDDILAAAVARLLLFTDPKKLPAIEDERGAWELYAKRCWRPGKPKPDTWPANHAAARAYVQGLEL